MRLPSRLHMLFAVVVLGGSLALAGCPKSPEVTQARPGPMGPAAATSPDAGGSAGAPGAAGSSAGEIAVTRPTPPTETAIPGRPGTGTGTGAAGTAAAGVSPLKDVFFEYDKAVVNADQRAALNDNVNWLKANSRAKIVIEGHCDERGTAEYNLGLGDRRSKALRDYLVASGIAADRIGTISYGKERPFVIGHDENAWKMNRRGHFAIQGQ